MKMGLMEYLLPTSLINCGEGCLFVTGKIANFLVHDASAGGEQLVLMTNGEDCV